MATRGAKELTAQERLFVEAYAGNAVDAARIAGYNAAEHYGFRLMRNPKIRAALKERNANIDSAFDETRRSVIMGRDEILEELSGIARNKGEDSGNRIKCMDLLGKAIGLWITKHEVTTVSYEDRLKQIMAMEASDEDAELEGL